MGVAVVLEPRLETNSLSQGDAAGLSLQHGAVNVEQLTKALAWHALIRTGAFDQTKGVRLEFAIPLVYVKAAAGRVVRARPPTLSRSSVHRGSRARGQDVTFIDFDERNVVASGASSDGGAEYRKGSRDRQGR